MNPVSMAGYQSSMQTPSLANFFGAAQVGQNRDRLKLAREQLELQAQKQAHALALQSQKQQGLAEYFGGQGQPQGQTQPQMPAHDPLAGGGAPMDTSQMQAPQPQMAPQQMSQQNPMARYAGLAKAGFSMDEIKGYIELERTGRKDEIENLTNRAGMMAQAAQGISALPEDQRAEEWLRQTNQIEQITGTDIPDHLQQYSPENLAMVQRRAIPVLDIWKQGNPAPTAAIQGYAQARAQGFTGTFMDYQIALKKAAASKTDVTVGGQGVHVPEYGKAPAGYAYRRNPDGSIMIGPDDIPMMAPITGTKEAEDRNAAKEQVKAADQNARTTAVIVREDVDRALKVIKNSTLPVTGFGSIISALPGTPQHQLSQHLKSIMANTTFDTLVSLKASGGTLGAISAPELTLLSSARGSLEQSQNKEDLIYNLERLQGLYQKFVIDRLDAKEAEAAKPVDLSKATRAELNALLDSGTATDEQLRQASARHKELQGQK